MKHLDNDNHLHKSKMNGRHHHLRHYHHDNFGIGQKLVYLHKDIDSLRSLFKSHTDLDWAVRLISSEGPAHKQIRSSLILGLVSKIFTSIKVEDFTLESIPVESTNRNEETFEFEIELPKMVLDMVDKADTEDIMLWIGEGPIEGIAFDLLLLNALSVLVKYFEESFVDNSKTDSNETE